MMNALIRLGMPSTPRAMTAPGESMSGLLDVSGSVDAFAEVLTGAIAGVEHEEDGGNGGDEGGLDILSFEGVESGDDETMTLELDLSIPLIFNGNIEKSKGRVEASSQFRAAERAVPSGKVDVAGNVIEQPAELTQDKLLANRVLSTGSRPDARILYPRSSPDQREPLSLSADISPAKEKAVTLAPTIIPKETQLLPDGLQQEPKAGQAAQDSIKLSLRSIVHPNPVHPNPVQPAPPSAPMISMPAVTMTEAVMPSQIVATVPAPVLPALDMQAGHQWIARLSHDIEQLSTENPVKPELNFQLKPEHLGKLSVRITADAAGGVVRLETENENVKALLLGSQGRLEQDIRLSGLKLARVDVTVQDHSGSQLGQHSSGPREGGAETGRNGSSQSQASLAEQGSPAQNGADVALQNGVSAASSPHGARYA